jgi:hypothetical protein
MFLIYVNMYVFLQVMYVMLWIVFHLWELNM